MIFSENCQKYCKTKDRHLSNILATNTNLPKLMVMRVTLDQVPTSSM